MRHVIGLALAITILAGCSVQLRTGPENAEGCDAALISGVLARSEATGLGVLQPNGSVQPVIWPFGYSARLDLTTVVLLDERGQLVAREGDLVEAGGGANGEGVFVACPGSIAVQVRID